LLKIYHFFEKFRLFPIFFQMCLLNGFFTAEYVSLAQKVLLFSPLKDIIIIENAYLFNRFFVVLYTVMNFRRQTG